MKPDQQRKMLEAAAKACGLRKDDSPYNGGGAGNTGFDVLGNLVLDWDDMEVWNSLDDSADCAEMCAKLGIDWMNTQTSVICGDDSREYEEEAYLRSHDNSRLKAWMYAATMVAAKIGGYAE